MLFPTIDFALFFMLVFALAWLARAHAEPRKFILLAASYFFYGYWDWRFLALIAVSSAVNYAAGRLIAMSREDVTRRWIVGIAVVLNLGVLGFFKYYEFFLDTLADLMLTLGWQRDMPFLEIVLPIGISFFTFQGISYVVDVYRGHLKPVTSPLDLFLYISFFPQLVAGPIVRASDFLPQLAREPQLTRYATAFGFLLIVTGLFKKTVVAHYIAVDLVDPVFVDPSAATSADLFAAHYAYAIQVFCDFSGYSDIAIGTAALLGYRFRKNFDRPFSALSLQQLWQRWHISLSTWLRDYLYRTLRGSKREVGMRMHVNVFLTMLLGGLWHGANWTFLIWGAIHGAALVMERLVKGRFHEWRAARARSRPRPQTLGAAASGEAAGGTAGGEMTTGGAVTAFAGSLAGWFVTFHVFTLSAVFFRSPELDVAIAYFAQMFAFSGGFDHFTPFLLALTAGAVAVQFLPGNALESLAERLQHRPAAVLGLGFGLALLAIDFLGPEGVAPFIYFQF